jgi:hypothetical protein
MHPRVLQHGKICGVIGISKILRPNFVSRLAKQGFPPMAATVLKRLVAAQIAPVGVLVINRTGTASINCADSVASGKLG